MKSLVAFSAVVSAIILGGILYEDAHATHFSEVTRWQLLYLTDTNVCSNYDHQMTVKYDEITQKYFDLYEFDNAKYEPVCVNHKFYDSNYTIPEDLDLIILVYSRNLGEVELHDQKMGGLFTHVGTDRSINNAIILCDCANFYYSDPVWILTHELAHFILYFLEYDLYVIEDLIHEYDEKYDQCRVSYDDSCLDILQKIRVKDMAYSFSVMPTYDPAIGQAKLKNNEVNVSPSTLELGKVITNWWTSGKITEGDYSNALGLLATKDQNMQQNKNVLFKDGPINDDETWQDVLFFDGGAQDKIQAITKVKEKLKIDEQEYQDTDFSGLPDWFKQTAQWWTEEKITDDEFVRNVKFLKENGIIRDHQIDQ